MESGGKRPARQTPLGLFIHGWFVLGRALILNPYQEGFFPWFPVLALPVYC